MSKTVKGFIENEYRTRFTDLTECVVVSTRGIEGLDNNEMRGALADKDITVTVVKNALARRLFADMGMAPLGGLINGPSAIAYGADSIVDLVKELKTWDEKLENLSIKGAYLDGTTIDATATLALAKLPNRVELQGLIVTAATTPGSNVVRAMTAPASVIAGCIKTLIENKE
jgi:large subunit ribosomal protein L10